MFHKEESFVCHEYSKFEQITFRAKTNFNSFGSIINYGRKKLSYWIRFPILTIDLFVAGIILDKNEY